MLMKKIRLRPYQWLLLILLPLMVFSCKKEESSIAPTNLVLTAQVSADGSGDVNFTATATHANRYYFDFGLGVNDPGARSTDGKAAVRYSSTGTYTVKVTAYSPDNKAVTATKQVEVTVAESGGGYVTPGSYPGMTLAWSDEFNGTTLNPSDWVFETGTGSNGWGNNELQYYRQENTAVQDGYLTITAKKESFGGREYTSSRIKTQDKRVFKYGRIDIRAKLPEGQGIWPALWMLGANISTVSWPASGELDIMELIGGGAGRDNTIHGTVHYDNNGYGTSGKSYMLANGKFSDQFHVFSIVWDAAAIKWLVDDVPFHEVDITAAPLNEFHNPFFLLLNVAVGGNWPGSPNTTTVFPQKMVVDYVRVFQK
jgi:beta-glucanase (GH16 family)